jgi:hypothetical protein
MASDRTEFVEKVLKIREKQALRAKKEANKTRKLQLQMLSMLKDCLQSHSDVRHRSKNSSANDVRHRSKNSSANSDVRHRSKNSSANKVSKSANGIQSPTATPSKMNKHSSDGIQDEFFMTGHSDDDSNNNNEVSNGCSTKQPTKSMPSKKPPNDNLSDSKDNIAVYTNEHPECTSHKTYRNDPSKCNKEKKEPFESIHKNDFFLNQRFSSEYGTESTHDKTPKENSDNALLSQLDTDKSTNKSSNEDPSQGCHNTNAHFKGQIRNVLSQNQLFASSDNKVSASKSDHIDDISQNRLLPSYHTKECPAKEYPNAMPSKSDYKNQDLSNNSHTNDLSTSIDEISQRQLFPSYHTKEYPAKEYPNTTSTESDDKNQDSSNSNHTNDRSTSNDLNVLPKIQVLNSTYAIAYPSTNAKFATNAICSSSASASMIYVQQFCFLPFNPHFSFMCYLTCQLFHRSFHRIFHCPIFTRSTYFQIILAKA